MFKWVLNTPLVKVVRTQTRNYFPPKLKKLSPSNNSGNLLKPFFSHRGFCVFWILHWCTYYMDAPKYSYLQLKSSNWILFTIVDFIALFYSFGNTSLLKTIKNQIFLCFQMLQHLYGPLGLQ